VQFDSAAKPINSPGSSQWAVSATTLKANLIPFSERFKNLLINNSFMEQADEQVEDRKSENDN
jgi:hypothetical protein